MGEPNVQLIEHNVKNNTEDIRDLDNRTKNLEKEVQELRADHSLTKQNVTHFQSTIDELKGSFRSLEKTLKKRDEQQLTNYKNAVFRVGTGLVIVFILIALGIKTI